MKIARLVRYFRTSLNLPRICLRRYYACVYVPQVLAKSDWFGLNMSMYSVWQPGVRHDPKRLSVGNRCALLQFECASVHVQHLRKQSGSRSITWHIEDIDGCVVVIPIMDVSTCRRRDPDRTVAIMAQHKVLFNERAPVRERSHLFESAIYFGMRTAVLEILNSPSSYA